LHDASSACAINASDKDSFRQKFHRQLKMLCDSLETARQTEKRAGEADALPWLDELFFVSAGSG